MLARITLPFTLSLAASVFAMPTPTEPGPGQVFREGGSCHVAWTADTTGTWTATTIALKTGDNLNMVTLMTAATGIDTTKDGVYDWTCPTVSPHAPIYFYEFSSKVSDEKTWTTRFTIADAAGNTDPAPHQTQSDGQAIPWGVGTLAGGASSPAGASSAPAFPSSAASISTPPSRAGSTAKSPSAPESALSVPAPESTPGSTLTTAVRASRVASTPTPSPGVASANGALTLAAALGTALLALLGALSLL